LQARCQLIADPQAAHGKVCQDVQCFRGEDATTFRRLPPFELNERINEPFLSWKKYSHPTTVDYELLACTMRCTLRVTPWRYIDVAGGPAGIASSI